jgi:hypothetical protein
MSDQIQQLTAAAEKGEGCTVGGALALQTLGQGIDSLIAIRALNDQHRQVNGSVPEVGLSIHVGIDDPPPHKAQIGFTLNHDYGDARLLSDYDALTGKKLPSDLQTFKPDCQNKK